MNLPMTGIRTRTLAPLAAPLVLTLALVGCSPSDTPAPVAAPATGVFTALVQTADTLQPASPTTTPAAPADAVGIPVHGPGLYRLDMGTGSGPEENKEQFLTCMFYESPGDVAICSANIPVRWKELDGQHRQARRVIISQDENGTLDVRADTEAMITTRILPTDITDEAVISGLYISVSDNEARFGTEAEEVVGSVLITPDSYEVITMQPTTASTSAATVRAT